MTLVPGACSRTHSSHVWRLHALPLPDGPAGPQTRLTVGPTLTGRAPPCRVPDWGLHTFIMAASWSTLYSTNTDTHIKCLGSCPRAILWVALLGKGTVMSDSKRCSKKPPELLLHDRGHQVIQHAHPGSRSSPGTSSEKEAAKSIVGVGVSQVSMTDGQGRRSGHRSPEPHKLPQGP